jgi:hypothetical protein
MPREKKANRRQRAPIVAAVVQPVAKRLSRIEDLLLEIRYEQDVKHKKIATLQTRLEELTAEVRAKTTIVRAKATIKQPISK